MSTHEDSEFVRHEPCENCSSSDAFALFSDNHGFCFSCGYWKPPTGTSTITQSNNSASPITYSGDFVGIPSRKLTEETLRKFNVRVENGHIRFPYYSSSGRIVGYKERDKEKSFRWKGKNTDDQLFGQQLFGSGKTLVCVEGELDALSVWQARKNWPVVSIPNGAKAAKKALSAQIKYLMGFDEVVLLFDSDSAGVEAAEECVRLLPLDKVFIASLSEYKDASEAIQAGDSEAIRQAVWNKRSFVPKSIIDGSTLFDLVSAPLHGRDAIYPYSALTDVTGGLRKREVVLLCSGSGCGKSTVCGEICQSLVDQGGTVGYIALEESVKRTALRLMSVKANKPLHLDNELPEGELRKAFDTSLGLGNVFFRDGFGSVDPDSILNDIRYLVNHHGVEWVILDHLSILMSGLQLEDERKAVDRTMTMLRSFCEETNVGMLLVSHLRRSQGDKGPEDGTRITLQMLRGSHALAQLSDVVIALQRDISGGGNTSELVVLKNRFTGATGPAGTLSYNKETGRLIEIDKPSTNTTTKTNLYDDF
jgi:twinkle protein